MDNLPPSAAATSKREQRPPVAQQLKSEVESAKKEAAKLKHGASEQATVSFESAKTNIMEAAQEAAGYGQGVVNEQKDRLAEIVEKYGQTAKQLRRSWIKKVTLHWPTGLVKWPNG
jgi:LysM repeat protein